MKKIFALLAITILLITACQPTPDEKAVVGKGEKQIEDMIEKAIDTPVPSDESEPELIKLEYSAPERLEYELDSTLENARMKIRINADVILPEYTLPIFKVAPRDITFEQVTNFLGLVKGDKELFYQRYAERIMLKKDIQQRIDTYLWEISMCEDEPDLANNYKSRIKELYKQLEVAPETYADANIQPEEKAPDQIHVDKDGNEHIEPAPEGAFVLTQEYIGPVTITKNNMDNYFIIGEGYDAAKFSVNSSFDSNWYQTLKYNSTTYNGEYAVIVKAKSTTVITDGFTLTEEDAKKHANEYVKSIDESLVLTDVAPAIYRDYTNEDYPEYQTGYVFYYGRQFNGVNTSYAEEFSYYSEYLASSNPSEVYQKPYPQESLIVMVGEDGIQSVNYTSPLDVVETIASNVELLQFEKIKEKFEQYIVYNAWDKGSTIYMNIEKVQLGLMRIAQPNSDEYLIVPVWDFYGSAILSSDTSEFTDDEYWEMISKFYNRSFLTINAIDGSIIDRSLGY